MTNLTKITTPFGALPRETQMALFEARLDGKDIEFNDLGGWETVLSPHFFVNVAYRVRPAPITYDNINWGEVAPQFIAMSRDSYGSLLRVSAPVQGHSSWLALRVRQVDATVFSSYTRGTCDWRESLVLRPGVVK